MQHPRRLNSGKAPMLCVHLTASLRCCSRIAHAHAVPQCILLSESRPVHPHGPATVDELSGGLSALRQISSWRRRRRLAELGLGAEPEPLSRTEPAAAATCPVLLIRRRTFGAAAAGYSLVSNPASAPAQLACSRMLVSWRWPAYQLPVGLLPLHACWGPCECQLLPLSTTRPEVSSTWQPSAWH